MSVGCVELGTCTFSVVDFSSCIRSAEGDRYREVVGVAPDELGVGVNGLPVRLIGLEEATRFTKMHMCPKTAAR
jgi:hypothetical protein